MWRRLRAGVGIMALLTGLAAAPYTHAHQTIDTAGDHAHGHTLVHAHATPHAHPHADLPDHHAAGAASRSADTPDEASRIWSVDSFVFQPPLAPQAPAPALLVTAPPRIDVTSVWHGAHRPQPRAHSPPLWLSSPLRAPPAFPPAFS